MFLPLSVIIRQELVKGCGEHFKFPFVEKKSHPYSYLFQ
jgi:hypothetical protein